MHNVRRLNSVARHQYRRKNGCAIICPPSPRPSPPGEGEPFAAACIKDASKIGGTFGERPINGGRLKPTRLNFKRRERLLHRSLRGRERAGVRYGCRTQFVRTDALQTINFIELNSPPIKLPFMKPQSKISRRKFLGRSAVAIGAGLAAPTIIPATALGRAGAIAPSERITMGFIGVGHQGGGHLLGGGWTYVAGGYAGRKDVQVLAVCDIVRDTPRSSDQKSERPLRRGHGQAGLCSLQGL